MLVATSIAGALAVREWYHRLLAPFNIAVTVVYITVLFARLS